jgi:hypothetical protein
VRTDADHRKAGLPLRLLRPADDLGEVHLVRHRLDAQLALTQGVCLIEKGELAFLQWLAEPQPLAKLPLFLDACCLGDPPDLLHGRLVQEDRRLVPKRVQTGAPRQIGRLIPRALARRKGRGTAYQAESPVPRFEIGGQPRLTARCASAGRDDLGIAQHFERVEDARLAIVQGVIIGEGHAVEAHATQVECAARISRERHATALDDRGATKARQRRLDIRVGNVAAADQLDHAGEGRIPELRHAPRDQRIAGQGQRHPFGHRLLLSGRLAGAVCPFRHPSGPKLGSLCSARCTNHTVRGWRWEGVVPRALHRIHTDGRDALD